MTPKTYSASDFEAAISDVTRGYAFISPSLGTYSMEVILAALRLASQPPAPIEGETRVVPIKPTPDMCIAGGIAWCDASPTSNTVVDTAMACWTAMLAAHPAQPEAPPAPAGDMREMAREMLSALRFQPVDPAYWEVIQDANRRDRLTSIGWRVTDRSRETFVDAIVTALAAVERETIERCEAAIRAKAESLIAGFVLNGPASIIKGCMSAIRSLLKAGGE